MIETAVEQDLVDLLIQQHTQIRDLFTEAGSTAAATRWGAVHRLVRLLAVHEVVDEQVVYSLIRLHVHGGDYIVVDRLAENRSTRKTLAAMEETAADAPEFARLLTELRMAVLERANHEEAYDLCYLRRDAPNGDLQALSAVLKAAERVLPAPSATESVASNPLTLFDRTKELARRAVRDKLSRPDDHLRDTSDIR